ncbi:unnamed protein product, partial [Staurois parvus]
VTRASGHLARQRARASLARQWDSSQQARQWGTRSSGYWIVWRDSVASESPGMSAGTGVTWHQVFLALASGHRVIWQGSGHRGHQALDRLARQRRIGSQVWTAGTGSPGIRSFGPRQRAPRHLARAVGTEVTRFTTAGS